MAHHILKDGTSYAVSGGSVLVNGTKYQIGGGGTLINGTRYEIGFSDGLTWVIAKNPSTSDVSTIYVDFESNGKSFSGFTVFLGNIRYSVGLDTTYAFRGGQWTDEAYRTLRFKEPPTGRMLEWLQANAVQQ